MDNSAVESFGGAVHADGCSLVLQQSLFLRNRGVSSGSVGGGMASAPPARMVLRKSPQGLPPCLFTPGSPPGRVSRSSCIPAADDLLA